LRDRHPDRVGIYLGFNESLAHIIEAGSDLFLMPSRYEPCGLNQMYSLKYGTPPVVRQTGGLADTVVNASLENLADGLATGFSFGDYTANALYETVKWALTLYRDRPADFRQIIRTAMAQDWSWDRSAEAYEKLYYKVIGS
jgi:starch synthase